MDKVIQGRKNRASGQQFERRVKADLQSKGWIVDRWMSNVGWIISVPKGEEFFKNGKDNIIDKFGRLFSARPKMLGTKIVNVWTGFPDFICFKSFSNQHVFIEPVYEVIGVEVKSNGYLTKEEKDKCKWLLDNNIFSKILIAKKGVKRGEIVYDEFK